MAKSNFSAFSKKLKKGEEALTKGRKGRRGLIEVDPGSYSVRFQSLSFGSNDKGIPFTHVIAVVVDAENEDDLGLKIQERISFEERSGTKNGKKWEITEQNHFENLCSCLQSFGVDTSEIELEDLEEAAQVLAEDQPACVATVVEKNGYTNVRWGKFVEDDELPSLDDVSGDEDDDEDADDPEEENEEEEEEEEEEDDVSSESDEDEEEEEDDDDDDDDDDDEDAEDEEEEEEEEEEPVVKGEEVSAKPLKTKKFAKYTVKSSNKTKETCTLVRLSDEREFKNVSWKCVKRG